MMLRVRHPGAEPRDIDLGPCPEIRSSGRGYVQAAVIGEMQPLIIGSVHSGMSDGHGSSKRQQSFSIRPENRYTTIANKMAPRCGVLMRDLQEPCARLAHHARRLQDAGHRSRRQMDDANDRKRRKTPARKAA